MSSPAPIAVAQEEADVVLPSSTVEVTFNDRYHFNLQAVIKKTFKYSDTWLTVADAFIRARPKSYKTTWATGMGRLGTDIPLTTTLADTLEAWKKDEEKKKRMDLKYCFEITAVSGLNLTILYEHINYAVAFTRAKLTWPLWHKDDTDVFNQQCIGAFDALRARVGSLQVPKNEDNGINNLVGIRGPGGLIKLTNVYQLGKFILLAHEKGNGIKDPFFFQDVPYEDLVELMEFCNACIMYGTLLSIYDLNTGEIDYSYHMAFEEYSEELGTYKQGQEEIDAARKHTQNMQISHCSSQAYQAIHDGKSLDIALGYLAPLSPGAQQEAGENITKYAKGLENESRSLVEMFVDSMKETPECFSCVFRRRGDVLVKLYPERYPPEERERLERIYAAVSIFKTMQTDRSLTKYSIGLEIDKKANEQKLQLLLTENDWTKMTPSITRLSREAKFVAAQRVAVDAITKYKKDQFGVNVVPTEEEIANNRLEARRIFKEMEDEYLSSSSKEEEEPKAISELVSCIRN
jgi:hypothetical protein